MENNEESIFERYGLEITANEVEVGKRYPIYGMITKFLSEQPGHVEVELNFSIKAHLSIPDSTKLNLLKERAFEPGIFISTILKNDGQVEVDCSTVVFGKRQEFQA
jgi:hypothetical protein